MLTIIVSRLSALIPCSLLQGASFLCMLVIPGIILLLGCGTSEKRIIVSEVVSLKGHVRDKDKKIQKRKVIPCGKYLNAKMDCNIRSGPGTNYPVIQVASKGDRFECVSLKNNWYRLETDQGKSERWLHSSVVVVEEAKPQDLDDVGIAKGEAVYNAVRKKYPSVELLPFFTDWMGKAHVVIEIPEQEWNRLSEMDKKSLELYAQSLVPNLRATPENYPPFRGTRNRPRWHVPGNTFWEKALRNCSNVCDSCWKISVGKISDRDSYGVKIIEDGSTVAKGIF